MSRSGCAQAPSWNWMVTTSETMSPTRACRIRESTRSAHWRQCPRNWALHREEPHRRALTPVVGFAPHSRRCYLMVHLDADLSVTLADDRPGTLAAALRCVGDAGINLDGYAEIGGVVHVLSPDLQKAHDALLKSGFRI